MTYIEISVKVYYHLQYPCNYHLQYPYVNDIVYNTVMMAQY